MTDVAKGFAAALEVVKGQGFWLNICHLFCRWHIYEAIKRHCGAFFKCQYPEKGKAHVELTRFITGFKDVVNAPTEAQMNTLWISIIEEGNFPADTVKWVKEKYYSSSIARKFMECYVFDCGNLHQTTTSRNEGSHAAYRSKATVIPKPTESYLLCCIHKVQWIQRLLSAAMNSRNRIPLEIRKMPELRDLAGRISIFALTEIRKQIIIAKKNIIENKDSKNDYYECHAFHRYELPCAYLVSTDDSSISFESIASFWRLNN